MVDYDSGYKKVFGQPEMVRDLIVGFVKQDWVDEVDFSTLTAVPTERITEGLKKRFNDIVWKVKYQEEDLYICIMLEFQSTPDEFMPLRILTYLGLLYGHLQDTHQLLPTGKLPPVLPIVLYNGTKLWKHSIEMHDLIEHFSDDLAVFAPRLQFFLLDENRISDNELSSPHMRETRNLVAALFRLEHAAGNRAIVHVVSELITWLDLPRQEPLSRAIAAWFNRVFRQSNEDGATLPEFEDLAEVKTMLQETMAKWWQDAKQQGREEGREEGRVEGRQEHEARGFEKGRNERGVQIARAMKAKGIEITTISEFTGLSVEEIENLS